MFTRITGNTFVHLDETNLGLYQADSDAYLIDGRLKNFEILSSILRELFCTLKAVYLTHGHIDHVSETAEIKKRYSAKVFCPKGEQLYLREPSLHSIRIFNSVIPPHEAGIFKPVEPVEPDGEPQNSHPFTVTPLPGHHVDMVGYTTPDGVFFAGDGLYGKELLMKHPILFNLDIGKTIKTIKGLRSLDVPCIVPAHGSIIYKEEIETLIDLNLAHIIRLNNDLVMLLKKKPMRREELAYNLVKLYDLKTSFLGYMIIVSTISNYLLYLINQKIVLPPTEESKYCYSIPSAA